MTINQNSIQFSCSNCGQAIQVSAKHAGRKGKCKTCGTTLRIPPSQMDTYPKLSDRPVDDVRYEIEAIVASNDEAVCLTNGRTTNRHLALLQGHTKMRELKIKGCPEVTDEGLCHLAGLKQLEILSLLETKITGSGIRELGGLRKLHTLDLSSSAISDKGLRGAIGLLYASIKRLDLSNTHITDYGLMHLERLTMLEALQVRGTQVTPAGASELNKMLPRCQIVGVQADTVKSALTAPRTRSITREDAIEMFQDKNGVSEWNLRRHKGEQAPDLTEADLSGCYMVGANLTGVSFRAAQCRKSVFYGAQMHDADFSDADLTEADLGGIEAHRANFMRANLRKANLASASLQWANFIAADCRDTSCCGADFQEAKIDATRFENAAELVLRGALQASEKVATTEADAVVSGKDASESVQVGATDVRDAILTAKNPGSHVTTIAGCDEATLIEGLSGITSSLVIDPMVQVDSLCTLAKILINYQQHREQGGEWNRLPAALDFLKCWETLRPVLLEVVRKFGDEITVKQQAYDLALLLIQQERDGEAVDLLVRTRPGLADDHEFWVFACYSNLALRTKDMSAQEKALQQGEAILSGKCGVSDKAISGVKQLMAQLQQSASQDSPIKRANESEAKDEEELPSAEEFEHALDTAGTEKNRLVNLLLSNSEYSRDVGLREARELARNGSSLGLDALRTSIETLHGKSCRLYKLSIMASHGDDSTKAASEIVALARRGQLMNNPEQTQRLISQAAFLAGDTAMRDLMIEVEQAGDATQRYHFQLLATYLIVAGELKEFKPTEPRSKDDTVEVPQPSRQSSNAARLPLPSQAEYDYFEVPAPNHHGRCSDDLCPCNDASLKRGSGYLYISPDVVSFRRDARSVNDLFQKLQKLASDDPTLMLRPGQNDFAAVFMCRKGAKRRGIDLDVAAADARRWWKNGQAPLRATPSAKEGLRACLKALPRHPQMAAGKIWNADTEEFEPLPQAVQQTTIDECARKYCCSMWTQTTVNEVSPGAIHATLSENPLTCLVFELDRAEAKTGTRVYVAKDSTGGPWWWSEAVEQSVSPKGQYDHRMPASKKDSPATAIDASAPLEWFVLPKGSKKRGPFSLNQLALEIKASGTSLRIRNTNDSKWVPLCNAGAIYPQLVESGVAPSPQNADEIRKRVVSNGSQRLFKENPTGEKTQHVQAKVPNTPPSSSMDSPAAEAFVAGLVAAIVGAIIGLLLGVLLNWLEWTSGAIPYCSAFFGLLGLGGGVGEVGGKRCGVKSIINRLGAALFFCAFGLLVFGSIGWLVGVVLNWAGWTETAQVVGWYLGLAVSPLTALAGWESGFEPDEKKRTQTDHETPSRSEQAMPHDVFRTLCDELDKAPDDLSVGFRDAETGQLFQHGFQRAENFDVLWTHIRTTVPKTMDQVNPAGKINRAESRPIAWTPNIIAFDNSTGLRTRIIKDANGVLWFKINR